MTRRIAPRFELWRCAKVVGGWTDWLLTGTFEQREMALTALDREIAARKVAHFEYPMKYEIRQVTTTIIMATAPHLPEERK